MNTIGKSMQIKYLLKRQRKKILNMTETPTGENLLSISLGEKDKESKNTRPGPV